MARKKRTPEENARREKIRELLQLAVLSRIMRKKVCRPRLNEISRQ